MKYVRIKTYHKGELCADHAYSGDNTEKAVAHFLTEYPEHRICTIETQVVDSDSARWKGYFKVADMCGCVHNVAL